MFGAVLMTITNGKSIMPSFWCGAMKLKTENLPHRTTERSIRTRKTKTPCMVYRFSRSLGRLLWLYTSIQFITAMKIYMSCNVPCLSCIGVDVFFLTFSTLESLPQESRKTSKIYISCKQVDAITLTFTLCFYWNWKRRKKQPQQQKHKIRDSCSIKIRM